MIATMAERFETKYEPEPNTGCWLWISSVDGGGYGTIATKRGRAPAKAHRVAYELYRGPIPTGLTLDHLCRVPRCVNPAHLEAVTHRVNVLRGVSPTSRNAAKTVCLYGHALTIENTYTWNGRFQMRQCRLCRQRRKKEWQLRSAM